MYHPYPDRVNHTTVVLNFFAELWWRDICRGRCMYYRCAFGRQHRQKTCMQRDQFRKVLTTGVITATYKSLNVPMAFEYSIKTNLKKISSYSLKSTSSVAAPVWASPPSPAQATAGSHRSQVVACRGKQLQMDVKGHLSISQLTSKMSQHSSERKGKSVSEGKRKLPIF